MPGRDIKTRASGGGEFDCYLALPEGAAKVPAVVLASAIHGVDLRFADWDREVAIEFTAAVA